MNELLTRISSYNIFNCLVPGVIFAYLVSELTSFRLIQDDLVIGFVLYYFIGQIISRIGSIIGTPLLNLIVGVNEHDYEDYIKAAEKDEEIKVFSEHNNVYRTYIATFILFFVAKIFDVIRGCWQWSKSFDNFLFFMLLVLIVVLFIFSYKKQTDFIRKRVLHQKSIATKEANHEQKHS